MPRLASSRFSSVLGLVAQLGSVFLFPAVVGANSPARPLYSLETNCSVNQEAARCKVEAFDGQGTTVYRTTVNNTRITYRLIDTPAVRGAQLWDPGKKTWIPLDRLSLNFETNQICINGESLCTTNPNYFSSLRESYPDLRTDLIISRFRPSDGRLSAICYSQEACDAGF